MLIRSKNFELEVRLGSHVYLRLGVRDWYYGNLSQ